MPKDVTASCQFDNPDDESLPLRKCVCGVTYASWSRILSIYKDDPCIMPCCGRRLYFSQRVTIHEVVDAERA